MGSLSDVLLADGRQVTCRAKGKLRIEGLTTTNPVVVGDTVRITEESGELLIEAVQDRHNYILRESPRRKMQRHVLAANIDQAVLVSTLIEPVFKAQFVDRFLVTCAAYHIPATIVLNKTDLWHEDEERMATQLSSRYSSAGVQVLAISAKEFKGLENLHTLLQHKTTLVAGQSGVGKSSLLNALMPELDLKTARLSGYTGKGMHTTAFACMFALPGGGFIIDTPGVKEWTLIDIKPEELSHYFPEFKKLLPGCKFNNCLHTDEPSCAVKGALDKHAVSQSRYDSYVFMLNELKQLNQWEIES